MHADVPRRYGRAVGLPMSHYEVLGVPTSATDEDVRTAYLARARLLHPDRSLDVSAQEMHRRHRQMQEVNEAWRVLGHPGRRHRYDLSRGGGDRGASPASTRAVDADLDRATGLDGPVDGPARMLRGLPWLLLLAVLGAIFVFTAYASGGRDVSGTADDDGTCVVVTPGPVAQPEACGRQGSRLVVASVTGSRPCPGGTERLQPIDRAGALCLEVAPSP